MRFDSLGDIVAITATVWFTWVVLSAIVAPIVRAVFEHFCDWLEAQEDLRSEQRKKIEEDRQ